MPLQTMSAVRQPAAGRSTGSVPPASSVPDRPGIPEPSLVQRIRVEYSYPLFFTRGLFEPSNLVLRSALTRREPDRQHRCLVVVDQGVADGWPELARAITRYAAFHADAMCLTRPAWVLPGGEIAKNDAQLPARILQSVNADGIDRQSFVVCVGGGALLDAVGYAAAIAHRGVRLIRVPSTVLSQNDSGVGVKNGINAFGKKNFEGTFAPPWAVLNDLDLLASLSRRDLVSGMSEAVKVALIRDGDFFQWMERNAEPLGACEPSALEYLIRRCAELHLEHIATSGDPFEIGTARPLDFGHWAAHKLESMTSYRLRHGEAVAIGIAIDVVYSELAGHLEPDTAEPVLRLLQELGLPLWDTALEEEAESGRLRVLDGLAEFREHLGGELTVTLLRGIGDGFEVHEMDEALIRRAILQLRHRVKTP
jgi:3-dehydroquinate synthase